MLITQYFYLCVKDLPEIFTGTSFIQTTANHFTYEDIKDSTNQQLPDIVKITSGGSYDIYGVDYSSKS